MEKNYPVAEEYLNVMAEYGFINTVNTYTRVQGGAKSCIDHLFADQISENYEEISPVVYKSSIKDHFYILLALKLHSKIEKNKQIIERWAIKYTDYGKLKTRLSEYDWDDLCNTLDVNKATKIIINKIKKETDECTTI